MIVHLCSVKDLALGEFLPLFQVPATAIAVRQFGDEVKSPEGVIAKHPEDYELWFLGTFDTASGVFDYSGACRLARAKDFV